MSGPAQFEYSHAADIPRARAAIVDVCARMHARGYIVAGDGNVSVRIGDRRMLVTPGGARKGFMRAADLVLCDLSGEPARGESGRPSSEMAMHVAVYEERPDARAIVHAHPPCAVAHTIAKVTLAEPIVPEALCAIGEVVTLPYTTPTTREVPDALRGPIRSRCALIMERHGSITIGPTLEVAYDRLEILEHTARISLMARTLALGGRVDALDGEQREQLVRCLGCGCGC